MAVRLFTFSSDTEHRGEPTATRPGFVRQTASDRPGVAQPVPERDIPERAWAPIWLGAVLLAVLLTGAWEWHWRAYGVTPSYANSDGQWAQQRRRIDNGEGDALVLVGSSRTLFDVQLPVWKAVTGEQPIQLALEGTSALPAMEELASDPKFHGRLMVGVVTSLFFTGFEYRLAAISGWRKQTPTQRMGTWLSMHFIEPYVAFDDPDYALETVLARQPWPVRSGTHPYEGVRKLSLSDYDRNTYMWPKVVTDAAYRNMDRRIWAQQWKGPPPPSLATEAKRTALANSMIDRAVKAVKLLRQHGARVVFVREPVIGPYFAFENAIEPPDSTWKVLLERTGAPGISFTDELDLAGFMPQEWSHLSHADALAYTSRLAPKVERLFKQGAASQVAAATAAAN
jgi:hypothetical protein